MIHRTRFGNVTVCCDDHAYVKLFTPSVHRYGFIYVRALQDMARQGVIEGALVNRADAIVAQVAEQDEHRGQLRFDVLADDEINHALKNRLEEEKRSEGDDRT